MGCAPLVFPTRVGTARGEDYRRHWRHRVSVPPAKAAGIVSTRRFDLRHASVSLLIAERRTVIDVAVQAAHLPQPCPRYCAHRFAELDPATRTSAEELIRKARLDAGGRLEDAARDGE